MLGAILLLLPQLGTAQIYKSTDEDGNVRFSDKPPVSGPSEQIKLRQTNSAPPPEPVEYKGASTTGAPEAAADTSYNVSVATPADETTIAMGPGNFSVSASVEPALNGGALLQLYVDGQPSGEPQSGNTWGLTNVFRGAHDLTVSVIDANGDQLAESEPVRVYVLRPSINYDNRKNRPQPRPTPR